MTCVLLDVDGVIADFVTPACRVISELRGEEFHPLDVLDYNLSTYVPPEHVSEFWRRCSVPGFAAGLEPYESALDGVRRLMADFEVYFVTSPMRDGSTWAYERAMWLKERLGVERDQIVSTGAKHLVRGDVFVDDSHKHVASWAMAHPTALPVLWARTYNENAAYPSQGVRTDMWLAVHHFARGVRA